MLDSMTFLINWSIAETYDLNTAAVMGWIFECCQQAVAQAGEKSGRGWVHVSQEELARRLHLTRQTVAKILKKLIDDRLIQAANSYTDEQGKQNYREFYPATKGIRGQTECCKLISKESKKRFARSKRRLIALASKEPLSKAGRCYTITYDGFLAMGLPPWEWSVRNHDALLSWGANEAVAAKVGVNAAVVFQYLWFWAHNWKFTPKQKGAWRLWKAYTAASISHWVVFMSDDVILDALHRLLDAGLIMKRRDKWVTEWAVCDAGYELMGKAVPCESAVPALRVVPQRMQREGKPASACEEDYAILPDATSFPSSLSSGGRWHAGAAGCGTSEMASFRQCTPASATPLQALPPAGAPKRALPAAVPMAAQGGAVASVPQSSSVGRGHSTLHPQPAGTPNANEEEARVEKTRQLLSVQLAYWQLEKRRARHKMRR